MLYILIGIIVVVLLIVLRFIFPLLKKVWEVIAKIASALLLLFGSVFALWFVGWCVWRIFFN